MFENFPYTDMHQLNLDWIIKIAKDFLDQYTSIQQLIESGIADLEAKKDEGLTALEQEKLASLQALQNKYNDLNALLEAWYTTHSEDIAGQLASAITSFNTAADQKGSAVIASIPDDYTAINAKIDYLTEHIYLQNSIKQRLDSDLFTYTDKILNQTGTGLGNMSGWRTTPYLPIISPNMAFTGIAFPSGLYYQTLVLYDDDFTVVQIINGTFDFVASDYPTAKYYRTSENSAALNDYYVEISTTSEYLDYIISLSHMFTTGDKIPSSFYTIDGILRGDGLSVSTNISATYKTTDYIPIFSKDVHFYAEFFPTEYYATFALYDASLTPLYIPHGAQHINLASYPTAMYFRASRNTGTPEYATYIGVGTENLTMEVGSDKLYTTLKAGIENAVKFKHTKLIVYPGTYNMVTEFGSALDNPSSNVGYRLSNDIELVFMAGSYVKALFPSSSTAISTYVSPFWGRKFTIHNLDLEASNCRYAIHDEQASTPEAYINTFDNCKVKMTSEAASGATMICPQCIGGGLGEHGVIKIIGGVYESYGDPDSSGGDRVAISYHNGGSANCDNRIIVEDVYLGGFGRLRFGYWGSSTIKSIVMVNNCSMADTILVKAETSGSTFNNF